MRVAVCQGVFYTRVCFRVWLPHAFYSIVVVSEPVDSNEKHVEAETLADTSIFNCLALADLQIKFNR